MLCVDASLVRVRNPDVPREEEVDQEEESEEEYIARLTDEKYSEVEQPKTKPAFGDDFNASFLKDLAGQRRKQEFAKKSEVKPSKPQKQEKSLSPISGRNTIPDPMKLGR